MILHMKRMTKGKDRKKDKKEKKIRPSKGKKKKGRKRRKDIIIQGERNKDKFIKKGTFYAKREGLKKEE